MNLKPVVGLSWLICAVAWPAEPLPAPAVAAPAGATEKPAATSPVESPDTQRPLNLRLRDIREYMTPEEFRALVASQDEDGNVVVVLGEAPLLHMKSSQDIPGGILTPFWALANPHKIWRLLAPDPRVDITKIPPPETAVPEREFRWGP